MGVAAMRPGPKFEITWEMAISNVQTVARRLGVSRMSYRLYEQHGSFSGRVLQRKFGWPRLVEACGLLPGRSGRPRADRRSCMQACGRLAMTTPGCHSCRTCVRRVARQSQGAML